MNDDFEQHEDRALVVERLMRADKAFIVALCTPVNLPSDKAALDEIGVIISLLSAFDLNTQKPLHVLSNSLTHGYVTAGDLWKYDALIDETVKGTQYVVRGVTDVYTTRFYILAPRKPAKTMAKKKLVKTDETTAALAKLEKLKAEAADVRDKIREALDELTDLGEKTEQAHDLLEQAADLISELV